MFLKFKVTSWKWVNPDIMAYDDEEQIIITLEKLSQGTGGSILYVSFMLYFEPKQQCVRTSLNNSWLPVFVFF